MGRVEYISNIQPPYGIKRYRYYEVEFKDNLYCVMGDDKEIKYTEDEIRNMFRPETKWEDVFVKNNKIYNKDKFKKVTKEED